MDTMRERVAKTLDEFHTKEEWVDIILAIVAEDREKLVKACEGIVANIEGGKLPVTLKGVAGSLRAALAGKEGK